ncbi:hypothetical protein E2C01_089683 [Portunus trituberculatus]|uniref:Uncharacterized protein n=1 Tax=Portunus trituberculatus TaxID=210409 RepID=A0A5B7J9G5_PORTR|nr:hypothetical protein [Portunus trituberculatus]
MGRVRLFR